MSEKDSDLRVLDASCRPAVPSLHTNALRALPSKACLVNDQHGALIAKMLDQITGQIIAYFVGTPHGATGQMLHAVGRLVTCLFS